MTNIVLTFQTGDVLGEFLTINATAAGVGVPGFSEEFVTLRQGKLQSTAPNGYTAAQAAEKYAEAYNLDWSYHGGTPDDLTSLATAVGNVVTINFFIASWQIQAPTGDAITNSSVTYVINNDVPEDDKTITLDGFSGYVGFECSQCYADVSVTGGTGPYNVYKKGSTTKLLDGVTSPMQIPMIRFETQEYRITDSLDAEIGYITITSPKAVSTKVIEIDVENTPAGANVTVTVPFIHSDVSPYTYSLTGSGYQSSNTFSGLAADNYTMYVKDNFGCVKTVNFVVDGVTEVTETVFYLSGVNALRYAKIDSNRRNYINTLSCNEMRSYKLPYIHKYQESESITTQFKTNAQYINAYAVTNKGAKTSLTAIAMTQNIGKQIKTTSTFFNFGEGQSALYFGVVDVLNYVTETVEYQTDFGFTLPEWANTPGQWLTIETFGSLKIDSIQYSETYNAFVAVFDNVYTGAPVSKKTAATYNLQPYEVYEFIADMSTLPELFNIVIEVGTDSNNLDFEYISEKIQRFVPTDRWFEINYSDSLNKGGMVYQTGITHKIWLEGLEDYVGESETEGYNGDTAYFVTDNSVFRSHRFTFPRLSSEMAHKMRLIVGHENLEINGIAFKLAEAPDVKSTNNNNLKTFSVTLKPTGDEFLTDKQEVVEFGEAAAKNAEIAAAIEAANGKALMLWTKTNG